MTIEVKQNPFQIVAILDEIPGKRVRRSTPNTPPIQFNNMSLPLVEFPSATVEINSPKKVPKWSEPARIRGSVRRLVEDVLQIDPQDPQARKRITEIRANTFKNNGLGWVLGLSQAGSHTRAIMFAYEELDLKEEEFPRFLPGSWRGEKAFDMSGEQIKRFIEQELGLSPEDTNFRDDVSKLRNKDFDRAHLGGMLSTLFTGSARKAIGFAYPSLNLKDWEYRAVPTGFWNKQENIREATRWLIEERLKILPADINFRERVLTEVTTDRFGEFRLDGMLVSTRLSLLEVLRIAYPDLNITIDELALVNSRRTNLKINTPNGDNITSLVTSTAPFLSLPQEQAWQVADSYWEYMQANPDARIDIPEYYAKVYLNAQGGSISLRETPLRLSSFEDIRDTDLPLTELGLASIFRGDWRKLVPLAKKIKAQLEIEHPEYFAGRKRSTKRRYSYLKVVTEEGMTAFTNAMVAAGVELKHLNTNLVRVDPDKEFAVTVDTLGTIFVGDTSARLLPLANEVLAELEEAHPGTSLQRLAENNQPISAIPKNMYPDFVLRMQEKKVRLKNNIFPRFDPESEFGITKDNLGSLFWGDVIKNISPIAKEVLRELEEKHPGGVLQRTTEKNYLFQAISRDLISEFILMMHQKGIRLREDIPARFDPEKELGITAEYMRTTFIGGNIKLTPIAKQVLSDMEIDYPRSIVDRTTGKSNTIKAMKKELEKEFIRRMIAKGIKLNFITNNSREDTIND